MGETKEDNEYTKDRFMLGLEHHKKELGIQFKVREVIT